MTLRLQIEHRTAYTYSRPVRSSHNETRMTPLTAPGQVCESSALVVSPEPSSRAGWRDYFGTIVESFEVMAPHDHLAVVQRADVATESERPASSGDDTEYVFASPMVLWDEEVAELARSLRASSPEETVRNVMGWMSEQMTYEAGTTVVGTSVSEVISNRRGVCQDYAHTCCAMLRALDIPARYVSGYFAPRILEAGEEVVAESHAWVEASIPGRGWWAVDPTNNQPAGEGHVVVGYGRDYSDVIPFAGVHLGRAEQSLEVTVTIRRLPDR